MLAWQIQKNYTSSFVLVLENGTAKLRRVIFSGFDKYPILEMRGDIYATSLGTLLITEQLPRVICKNQSFLDEVYALGTIYPP